MGIDEVLKDKREDVLRIASKHGAKNIRVFGSVARGQAGPESDIDLLVDLGPKLSPFFPGGLVTDLEDVLGRQVQVVTEQGLHWYIRERILKEAVPL